MDRTLSGQQRDSLRRRPPYRETCSRSGSNQGGATDHKAQSDQRVGRAERYGKSVAVVVLGDIGRSPRMQYHAMSLAENGFNVDLIGYKGATPMQRLTNETRIQLWHVHAPRSLPEGSPKALFLLYAPIKILYQLAQLLWLMLFAIRRPSHILVQNPPAIPTLAIAYLVAVIRRSQLVVDWHNYGYTILGLKLGTHHPVVRVAEWYERLFGPLAASHLCVTDAMKWDLERSWNIGTAIVTLHDRAPSHFKRLTLPEAHRFWTRLIDDPQFACLKPLAASASARQSATPFTVKQGGRVVHRASRPFLLVSSTSWTEDEDFSVLLDALKKYDALLQQYSDTLDGPRLVLVITGKGPLRSYYQQQIARCTMRHVIVVTAWLAAEDYVSLLGSADLGISLHTSSSGLDLPMKVVDMFGCGLPVCAFRFRCIGELVKEGINGYTFGNSDELVSHLKSLFSSSPDLVSDSRDSLVRLTKGTEEFRRLTWQQNWNQRALPLFV